MDAFRGYKNIGAFTAVYWNPCPEFDVTVDAAHLVSYKRAILVLTVVDSCG
jgi:hypothetical protein